MKRLRPQTRGYLNRAGSAGAPQLKLYGSENAPATELADKERPRLLREDMPEMQFSTGCALESDPHLNLGR